MGVERDWEKQLEPVTLRHPLEARNSLSSDGYVDIKKGVFQDNRLPHTVYVDSIAHQTLDQFEDRGVDLMVREVPMQDTPVNAPELDNDDYGGHRTSPDIVLFDLDNMTVAGYDAKSFPAGEQGMEDLRQWGKDVRAINDFYDMDWEATGHDIQRRHINDSYRSPGRSPRGVYATETSLEHVKESDELRNLFDGLYGDAVDIEDAMLVSEVKEEWKL